MNDFEFVCILELAFKKNDFVSCKVDGIIYVHDDKIDCYMSHFFFLYLTCTQT